MPKVEEKPSVQTEEKKAEYIKNKNIDYQKELLKTWEELADKFKVDGKTNISANMRSVLKQLKFENGNITFHVNNSFLLEQYTQAKAEIIPLLRERLFTENINLNVILDEIKVEKVAFTGKEKFEKMAKLNPQILELKKTLGLDIEF